MPDNDKLTNFKLDDLNKRVEANDNELNTVRDTLGAILIAIQKIEYTLQRIEKVESDNKNMENKIIKIEEKVTSVASRQNRILGGLVVLVFVIELGAKVLPLLLK